MAEEDGRLQQAPLRRGSTLLGPESEGERRLRARVHRHMGMTATILVGIAVVVALGRMKAIFGVSAWEALGIGMTGLPWILLILGLGVLVSLGTTRLMLALAWIASALRRRRAGG